MKRICSYEYTFSTKETAQVENMALMDNSTVIVLYENHTYQTFDLVKKTDIKSGKLPTNKHIGQIIPINSKTFFLIDDLEMKGYIFDIETNSVVFKIDGPLSTASIYSENEIWRLEGHLSKDKSKLILMEDTPNSYFVRSYDLLGGNFDFKVQEVSSSNKDFSIIPLNNDKVLFYPNTCEKGEIEFVITNMVDAPRTFKVQTNITENHLFVMKATTDGEKAFFWANNNGECTFPGIFVVSLPKTNEDEAKFIEEKKLNFPTKEREHVDYYNFYECYLHDAKNDLVIIEICDAVGIKLATISSSEDQNTAKKLYNSTTIPEHEGEHVRQVFEEQIIQYKLDLNPAESGITFKIFRPMNLAVTVISLMNSIGILDKFSEGVVKAVVEKFKTSIELK